MGNLKEAGSAVGGVIGTLVGKGLARGKQELQKASDVVSRMATEKKNEAGKLATAALEDVLRRLGRGSTQGLEYALEHMHPELRIRLVEKMSGEDRRRVAEISPRLQELIEWSLGRIGERSFLRRDKVEDVGELRLLAKELGLELPSIKDPDNTPVIAVESVQRGTVTFYVEGETYWRGKLLISIPREKLYHLVKMP